MRRKEELPEKKNEKHFETLLSIIGKKKSGANTLKQMLAEQKDQIRLNPF